MPPARFAEILRALAAAEVEFIVVGMTAGILQGAPVTTMDVDVVHRRTTLERDHAGGGRAGRAAGGGPARGDRQLRPETGRPSGGVRVSGAPSVASPSSANTACTTRSQRGQAKG